MHFLKGLRLFADRHRDRGHADGAEAPVAAKSEVIRTTETAYGCIEAGGLSNSYVIAATDVRFSANPPSKSAGLLNLRSEIFVNWLFAQPTGQTVVRVGGHQGSDSVSISHPPLEPLPDPIPLKFQSPISKSCSGPRVATCKRGATAEPQTPPPPSPSAHR